MIHTSFRDSLLHIWKMRSRLLRVGAVTALVTFCVLLVIERPAFLARASVTAHTTTQAPSALSFLSQQDGLSPVAVFLSQRVLREVVEEVGLQVTLKEKPLESLLQRVEDNLFAEWGRLARKAPPPLLSHVRYEGGESLSLALTVSPSGKVFIESLDGNHCAEGRVDSEIRIGELSFVVPKESQALLGERHVVQIVPWSDAVEKLKKEMRVKPDLVDKRLLRLTAPGRSREEAEKTLATWIHAYRRVLHEQAESVASAIGTTTKELSSELRRELEGLITRRAVEMQKSLHEEGWMGVQQELSMRMKPKKDVWNRILELQERREKLKFHDDAPPFQSYLAAIQTHLEEVASRIQQAGEIKDALVNGKEMPQATQLIEECGLLLNGTSGNRDLVRLNALIDREKKRRFFLQEEMARPAPVQLEELKQAEEALRRCEEELHAAKEEASNLKGIEEAMVRGDVEPTALSRYLNDPVGTRQLEELQALTSKLATPHLTSFERKRLQEQRSKLCETMNSHLGDLLQLCSWKSSLLQGRRAMLRSRVVELIDSECEAMKRRLVKAGEGMDGLAEKWRGETLFYQQRDALMTASRDLVRQTAGQIISCRLPAARTLALDAPFASHKPQKPHLFLISLMSGLFGMFMGIAFWWQRSRENQR